MRIVVNGEPREVAVLPDRNSLLDLVVLLALKADQVAIEQNGSIVRRAAWQECLVQEGDRFEIVQFVGGGCTPVWRPPCVRSPVPNARTRCASRAQIDENIA